MKCTNCGADILEGQLYCENCGTEVQMVPDYNPLDEILAEQVKGVLYESARKQNRETGRMSTGMLNTERSTGRMNAGRNTGAMNTSRNTGMMGANRRPVSRNTGRSVRETEAERLTRERAQKKRQTEQRKAKARKKRRILITSIIIILVIIITAGIFTYRNSYSGLVKRGYSELQATEYLQAESLFKRAIKKSQAKAEAYTGLSKVYMAQDQPDTAEQMFITAITSQPDNVEIYKAVLEFYLETDQETKISPLLADCDEDLLSQLKAYVSEQPQFSLSDEEVYEEVQQLSLTGTGEKIYYTIDGSEPTAEAGSEYTDPIQLEEGITEIKAVSVNRNGIPSLQTSRTYTIELPIQDAPAVTPSTGQYEENKSIEIRVPEGYTAYYTTDGTTPTQSSHKYTEAIEMPEGNTLFSAVLIDGKGRVSDVTKRNYELTLD